LKRSKKIVYKYSPYISIFKEDVANKFLKRKNFHRIILQNAAMVVLENKEKKVLFLNEYRRGIKQKSLGFPGGHLGKNENPLSAIKRELFEETGLIATNWKLLFNYVRSGTYYCGKDYVFKAKLKKNNLKYKGEEKIEKKWLSKKEIVKKFKKKKFKTVGIMVAVLFYILNFK
jgi:ADP-ribose pyrophosphatase